MRSRARRRCAAVALAAVLLCPGVRAQDAPPAANEPTPLQVRKALDKVALDPNLAAERTVSTLHWRKDKATREPASWLTSLREWTNGLFGWLAESARWVLWVVVAILAAAFAVYLVRVLRIRGAVPHASAVAAPTHVRDLDIRPESLPDDVGGAARALFEGGAQRAALALLYRALLSRLVHVHGVEIRASSTEGECLALALPRLPTPAGGYVRQLIGVWQRAVYAHAEPSAADVRDLCARFQSALEARAPEAEIAA